MIRGLRSPYQWFLQTMSTSCALPLLNSNDALTFMALWKVHKDLLIFSSRVLLHNEDSVSVILQKFGLTRKAKSSISVC